MSGLPLVTNALLHDFLAGHVHPVRPRFNSRRFLARGDPWGCLSPDGSVRVSSTGRSLVVAYVPRAERWFVCSACALVCAGWKTVLLEAVVDGNGLSVVHIVCDVEIWGDYLVGCAEAFEFHSKGGCLLALDLNCFCSGVTEVSVVGHDAEPIGAAVAIFSVGAVTARENFFPVKLKVA